VARQVNKYIGFLQEEKESKDKLSVSNNI